MEFLRALGHDVVVKITPTRRKHGAMSVGGRCVAELLALGRALSRENRAKS
jgi:hypothetical protein